MPGDVDQWSKPAFKLGHLVQTLDAGSGRQIDQPRTGTLACSLIQCLAVPARETAESLSPGQVIHNCLPVGSSRDLCITFAATCMRFVYICAQSGNKQHCEDTGQLNTIRCTVAFHDSLHYSAIGGLRDTETQHCATFVHRICFIIASLLMHSGQNTTQRISLTVEHDWM